jgi:hypothetical protein
VSSEVSPHVDTCRTPPSGTCGPSERKYTRRGPAVNTENPARHDPTVCKPVLPYSATLAAGASPLSPLSDVTLRTGSGHMPVVVGVTLGVAVWLPVRDWVADVEAVSDCEAVVLGEDDDVRDGVPVSD